MTSQVKTIDGRSGWKGLITSIMAAAVSQRFKNNLKTMTTNIHKGLIGVRKDSQYRHNIGFYQHNPAGTKLAKKVGARSEKGGTLTICNPGGVISETFRDIAQARHKMNRINSSHP